MVFRWKRELEYPNGIDKEVECAETFSGGGKSPQLRQQSSDEESQTGSELSNFTLSSETPSKYNVHVLCFSFKLYSSVALTHANFEMMM